MYRNYNSQDPMKRLKEFKVCPNLHIQSPPHQLPPTPIRKSPSLLAHDEDDFYLKPSNDFIYKTPSKKPTLQQQNFQSSNNYQKKSLFAFENNIMQKQATLMKSNDQIQQNQQQTKIKTIQQPSSIFRCIQQAKSLQKSSLVSSFTEPISREETSEQRIIEEAYLSDEDKSYTDLEAIMAKVEEEEFQQKQKKRQKSRQREESPIRRQQINYNEDEKDEAHLQQKINGQKSYKINQLPQLQCTYLKIQSEYNENDAQIIRLLNTQIERDEEEQSIEGNIFKECKKLVNKKLCNLFKSKCVVQHYIRYDGREPTIDGEKFLFTSYIQLHDRLRSWVYEHTIPLGTPTNPSDGFIRVMLSASSRAFRSQIKIEDFLVFPEKKEDESIIDFLEQSAKEKKKIDLPFLAQNCNDDDRTLIQALAIKFPREMMTKGVDALVSNFKAYVSATKPYQPPIYFLSQKVAQQYPMIKQWFQNCCLTRNKRSRALVLYSSRRALGKTTFAQSLTQEIDKHGRASNHDLFIISRNTFTSADFKNAGQAILFIIDDLDWSTVGPECKKALVSCEPTSIRSAYCNYAWQGGLPTVITTNDIDTFVEFQSHPNLAGQCYCVEIEDFIGPEECRPTYEDALKLTNATEETKLLAKKMQEQYQKKQGK